MKKIYLFVTVLWAMLALSVATARAEGKTLAGAAMYYGGNYANAVKTVDIVDNGDGTYTLKDLYHEGYDVTFSINDDHTLGVVGVELDSYGYYNVVVGPEGETLVTYTSDGYSYGSVTELEADFEWGHYEGDDWIYERVCWTQQWTLDGTFGYYYDWTNYVYDTLKSATLVSNGGGKYTLKNPYAVGYDLEFVKETDGSLCITNAVLGSDDYYYLYDGEGEDDYVAIYPWVDYAGLDITGGELSVWWYRYDGDVWGMDCFWADSSTLGVKTVKADRKFAGDGIRVYNTAGRLEYSGSAAGMGALPKGVHIIQSAEGARKVLVR